MDPEALRALRHLADAGVRVVVVRPDRLEPPDELRALAADVLPAVPGRPGAPAWYLTSDISRCQGSSARLRTVLIGGSPPNGSVRRCDAVARDVQAAAMEILAEVAARLRFRAARGPRDQGGIAALLCRCKVRRRRPLRHLEGRNCTITRTRRSLVATFPPLGTGLPGRTPALLRPSGPPDGRALASRQTKSPRPVGRGLWAVAGQLDARELERVVARRSARTRPAATTGARAMITSSRGALPRSMPERQAEGERDAGGDPLVGARLDDPEQVVDGAARRPRDVGHGPADVLDGAPDLAHGRLDRVVASCRFAVRVRVVVDWVVVSVATSYLLRGAARPPL